MKQSLPDLNGYLFEELDRLSNEDMKGEQLDEELRRAKAITGVASQVIANAQVVVRAEELRYNLGGKDYKLPKMLEE